MADIEITDQLDKPIETIKVDLTHPSTLVNYLKTEVLHLAVFPDFLTRAGSTLSQAAPKPIQFQLKASNEFQLGNTKPAINITPTAEAQICVNASPGTNLFDADPFPAAVKVPEHTGYVSVGFQGSLDAGVSLTEGDLCFGFDKTGGISLEYQKAFPLGTGEPKLGDALGATMSGYVIPWTLSDLGQLGVNDIATVSGSGSLKISAGLKAQVAPNPLASVALPLNAGTVNVEAGPTARLSASFTISGSYQVRAHRLDANTLELSFVKERGTQFQADWSVSAGIAADLGTTDLIATALGAIDKDAIKPEAFTGLHPDEAKTLASAIKGGLDRSLRACVDLALSEATDDQAAFQYRIQPAQLTPVGRGAVEQALRGDLTLLTAMEQETSAPGVALSPGIQLLTSVLTATRKRGVTLKVNLLGILNFTSLAELVKKSETLTDNVTGDVTIKETVTGNRISSLVEPAFSSELRKAMFDSVMATTTYRAGKVVTMPGLSCEQVHFALNHNTNRQTMADYLNWFVALRASYSGAEIRHARQLSGAGNRPACCGQPLTIRLARRCSSHRRETSPEERIPGDRAEGDARADRSDKLGYERATLSADGRSVATGARDRRKRQSRAAGGDEHGRPASRVVRWRCESDYRLGGSHGRGGRAGAGCARVRGQR